MVASRNIQNIPLIKINLNSIEKRHIQQELNILHFNPPTTASLLLFTDGEADKL